ncbi:hypothetical protein APHAL10511_002116 [Amanita phalloides]|nr:hypothetical protein APHAL10511_002116 [Amanita phalloides]
MGKGAKKTSKLVKSDKQEKQKRFDKEDEPSIPQPPAPSVPSPIPEEAESGYVAQDSVHGDDQTLNPVTFASDSWGARPSAAWHSSGTPSQATSPRREDRSDFPDSVGLETHSQNFSWAERSTGASYDQEHKQYRSSPYPGPAGNLGPDPASLERGVPGSNSDSGLEYIVEEPSSSGMVPDSNVDQHWTSTTAGPLATRDQQSGPAFGVYATSFSNPPAVPNPRPPPPNVISTASDAAARLVKTKNVDVTTPAPPQSQYVPPAVATWHSWIRSDAYKPKIEVSPPPPVAPPPAMPQAPPLQRQPAIRSGMPTSVLKGPSNPPRAPWGRHSKRASVGTWTHPPNANADMHGGAAWSQRGPSTDGLAGYQAKHSYDGSNDGGGWYDENKKGHGKSKNASAWAGKRFVQWEGEEEEEENDESDETEDDGWGEADDDGGGGDWEKSWGKKDNAWSNAEREPGGMAWPKRDDGRGESAATGWDQSGWSQGANGWSGHPSSAHGLGDERKRGNKTSSGGDAIRATVSTQQRTEIFNSLLNMTDQTQGNHPVQKLQRSDKPTSKKMKQGKENKRQTLYSTGWGLDDNQWGVRQEDETGEGDRTRSSSSKRASAAWDGGGGGQDPSRYSMPSLTLSYAYKDSNTRLDHGSQSKLNDIAKRRFHESKGIALHPVHNAFFGQARLARDRIFWVFSPDKDERVRAALSWIQEMSYGLGALALHKFLQHRERGALLINADYNPPDKPKDFAVDYLAFHDLQKSFDKTLQTSVTSYDPAVQAIVFVFLPSKSGNSIAIWRRKLLVPNNARLRFQSELDIALSGLKEPKDYAVFVDEVSNKKKDLPATPSGPVEAKPKKRKWWQFFKFKS